MLKIHSQEMHSLLNREIFTYTCMHAKSLKFCLTLCDPMNYSPPGSSVHGIFQARIMDGGAWRAIVHRVTKSHTQLKWLKHRLMNIYFILCYNPLLLLFCCPNCSVFGYWELIPVGSHVLLTCPHHFFKAPPYFLAPYNVPVSSHVLCPHPGISHLC